jgi:transposase InsO family protein
LQHFATRNAAMTAIFHYIEAFYNPVRPHSSIGWIAPNTFEVRINSGAFIPARDSA